MKTSSGIKQYDEDKRSKEIHYFIELFFKQAPRH
jgi:hypothetical protein